VGERFQPDDPGNVVMLFPKGGGSPRILGLGFATDINNSGLITGMGFTTVASATVWNRKGVVQSTTQAGVPTALNARGSVVGISFGTDGAPNHAFFWNPKKGFVMNLDPDATGSEAQDINDRGQIVGTINNLQQAVIWRVRP
jgi:probable HAF family extracellular repeat protein